MREQKTENGEQRGSRNGSILYSLFSIRCSRRASRGFTLIELLLVCTIMALMAALIMTNQNQFGGQVLLQNFVYDVALSIRQAQVYGISVQRYQSSRFDVPYGMHFSTAPGARTSYILFADQNKNGIYDTGENVQAFTITRGYTIQSLCRTQGGDELCTDMGITALDIVFRRPEPDAAISWTDTIPHSCILQQSNCAERGRIIVQSPRGETMGITVLNNGQIAVDQTIAN